MSAFYERSNDGSGYLSKASMACALEGCGFNALGCYDDGWYFEVKIIE